MTKQEEIMPMDDKLHRIGTLMYTDDIVPSGSTDWKKHRIIWRVSAHRECQDYPGAPIRIRDQIEMVRQKDL